MGKEQTQKRSTVQTEAVKFLALGGVEDVTRNMYVYEYQDQILLVDCGLGFPDESMLGVDFLLPDITYLVRACLPEGRATKHIVGIPIYGSPLTAALANEKLAEFHAQPVVQAVPFTNGNLHLGEFTITLIHVTHSIPDAAHLFIETPVGNFYHGADYQFDLTPADQKRTEFVNVPPVRDRRLLRRCRRWPRPDRKLLVSQVQNHLRGCRIPIQFTPTHTGVPPFV